PRADTGGRDWCLPSFFNQSAVLSFFGPAATGQGLAARAPGLRVPRHEEPEPLLARVRGVERRDDAPLEHHRDAVGERADLVELARDEEDSAAARALLEQPLVHVLRCRDVEAARRLADDDEPRRL